MSRKDALKMAYVVIFILLLAIPGIWTFVGQQDTIGNEETVDFSDANYWNIADKVDDYLNQKFGFRNKLVDFNNRLNAMLGESGNKEVIMGKDGWLYFSGALHDYTGTDRLTDVEIDKIVKILLMTQENVEADGSKFIFASAPNKMEIYGENMPYYHVEDERPGNYENLFARLEVAGVSCVDLKKILNAEKEDSDYRLYYKRDSDWNDVGAFIAYESIMEALELDYVKCSKEFVVIENGYKGDLDKMLFPDAPAQDEHIIIEKDYDFYYTSNYRGSEDLVIQTANDNKDGNLIMWRDSFGAFLYYKFAENFNSAEFRRELPYNFTNIGEQDAVVIEIVERNLKLLLENPPVIEHKEVVITTNEELSDMPECSVKQVSGNQFISVEIDNMPKECIKVYFKISTESDDKIYEAYPSGPNGNPCMYIKELPDNAKLSVMYEYNGKIYESLKNSLDCV